MLSPHYIFHFPHSLARRGNSTFITSFCCITPTDAKRPPFSLHHDYGIYIISYLNKNNTRLSLILVVSVSLPTVNTMKRLFQTVGYIDPHDFDICLETSAEAKTGKVKLQSPDSIQYNSGKSTVKYSAKGFQ